MAGFSPMFNALGAGLGMGVSDLVQQRQREQQMALQQMGMQRELAYLQMALQNYQQNQFQQQLPGILGGVPDVSGQVGGGGIPGAAGAAPAGGGMSVGGATDPASLVKKYESGGRYNVGYGGADLSSAPLDQYGFPQWPGKMGPAGISHAAGAYQFQPDTWRPIAARLGIHDFSPASQDAVFSEASKGGKDFSPWAPYNPQLNRALNQRLGSPPSPGAPAPVATSGSTGPAQPPAGAGGDTADFMQEVPGSQRPFAPGEREAAFRDLAQGKMPGGPASAQGTQVAQASIPPEPRPLSPQQIEQWVQSKTGLQPGDPRYGMAVRYATELATKKYAQDRQIWETQRQTQMWEKSIESQETQGTQIIETDKGPMVINKRTGEARLIPLPEGAKPLSSGAQSTGRERDMEREIARRDAQIDPKATQAEKDAAHFRNRLAVEGELATGKAAPARGLAAAYMRKWQQERDAKGMPYSSEDVEEAAREYTYNQRAAASFAGGQNGQKVVALNTVAGHLNRLQQYADALAQGNLPAANQLLQSISVQLGKPEVTNFNTARDITMDEVVRLLTSSGGTITDREQMQKNLIAKMSPEQMNDGMNVFKSFVGERFGALEQAYQGIGPPEMRERRRTQFETDLLTPQSRDMFARVSGDQATTTAPPPPGGGQQGHPPVPQSLQGKTLRGWSPSTKLFYDDQGNSYDQNGNPVNRGVGPPL